MMDAWRVLLVEDDPDHADLAVGFLTASGPFQVTRAGSLREQWQALERGSFDVILLDYSLPDGSGLDALSEISRRGFQIPVIMVTGMGDERVAAQAIQRGAIDYLVKADNYLLTLPALIHKALRVHGLQLAARRSLEQISYQALLLKNMRDAVVVWDTAGIVRYWNPAAEDLFGYSADDSVGLSVAQAYAPLQRRRDGGEEATSIGEGEGEWECVLRDGRRIWISSRVMALHSESDGAELVGHMDVSRDISARMSAEQALRLSEARNRALVDAIPDSILMVDSAGELLEAQPEGAFAAAVMPAPRPGEPISHSAPAEFADRLTLLAAEVLRSVSPQAFEFQIGYLGATHFFEVRLLASRDLKVMAIVRDITERKKMELRIQAAQSELVQTARLVAIGELASGVAHQISNPLTTVIGEAQILRQTIGSDQSVRDSAEAIEQAGWCAQEAVQRLLEFSQPASEQPEPQCVNRTIEVAMALGAAKIRSGGTRLEADLAEDLPPVCGRAHQLQDLWLNLLLLARDATADGKDHVICLTTARGEIGNAVVTVRDDGRLIPADRLPAIFEPSYTGSDYGRGSGMELGICREIVRRHRGQISISSAAESGTIVTVSLPGVVS